MNGDPNVQASRTNIAQISNMLRTAPDDWRDYVPMARATINHLDTARFLQQPTHFAEQISMVTTLQHLALSDSDRESIPDVATWCSQQWLVLRERSPQNISILRGIGQGWLGRAQPILSQIHGAEHSWSSCTGPNTQSLPSFTLWEDDGLNGSTAEAERRAGLEDYVEVRGFLLPATDYLDRAVAAAQHQNRVDGDLLVTTAEAYMALGDTSSPRVSEPYFRRALQLLREANNLPDYTLSHFLQQYLDDYGRFVD